MSLGLSEQRLSRWAVVAAAVSFILPLLGVLLMFGAATAAGGDLGVASTKGFWIGAALFVGYFVSIYLLSSLPGKGRARRLGSWTFSVAFHALVLVLGATVGGLGRVVAIFMGPEVVVVALSTVGLIISARRPRGAAPNSSFQPTPRSGAAER